MSRQDAIRHGILNIDKPLGLTSHDVIVRVRRASRQNQVGHAGTLDPLATGVLVVCLGRATRVSEYLMGSSKTYRATITLGISTTTHDAEGEIVAQRPVDVSRAEVEQALAQFVGTIEQVPPMHSAVKQGGKKLYKLARRGITVERKPKQVEIFTLDVLDWTPPHLDIQVRCGPGTYIRALARDLGGLLGCGAYLSALRRTQSGQFGIDDAASLAQIEAAFAEGQIARWLYGLDAAFADLPEIHLDGETAYRLAMGQSFISRPGELSGMYARAYGPGRQFVALIGRCEPTHSWKPIKVFVKPDEIKPCVDELCM